MRLQDKVAFDRRAGIELTFVTKEVVPAMDRNPYHKNWGALAEMYKRKAENRGMVAIDQIMADPGCVEYPSPILSSWEETQRWWKLAIQVGKELDLVTYHEDQYGGMGHIHIEMTQVEAAMMTADALCRPYLSWVLATPHGTKFCKSVIGAYLSKVNHTSSWRETLPASMELRYPLAGDEVLEVPVKIDADRNRYNLYTFYQTYDSDGNMFAYKWDESETNRFQMTQDRFSLCPYNYTYGTLEWRAFDAAHDWSMQEGQMAFIQRYAAKVLSGAYPPAPFTKNLSRAEREKVLREFRGYYAKDIDRCIRDFKDLIVRGLELPWKRYKFYVDMNLVPCFEWGQRI